METIILKYDKKNASIEKALELMLTLGVEIEKAPNYNPDFVKKIEESERQFKNGKYKTIKTADLWK